MSIVIPGYTNSAKAPGAYFAEVFGGQGTNAGEEPIKTLLVGNMIGSAIALASPSLTSIPAGTASLSQVYTLFSPDDARGYFGPGSELHRQALAFFAVYPSGTCYAIATAEGSTASTGVITVTGTPTAAMVARVYVNEDYVDVPIAISDTATTIAAAMATAVCQQPTWPAYAQNSAGVLTFTAKHAGIRGKNHQFRVSLISSTQTAESIAGALAGATLNGSVLTLSGGTAVGTSSTGAYVFTGGTTEETTTAALTAIQSTKFHRIVLAQQTSTELARVDAQVVSQAGVNTQLRQQWVAGSVATLAAATTLATTLNAVRGSLAWSYVNPEEPGVIAARYAAGRLNGNAEVGGAVVGEAQDANANLDGIVLKNSKVPRQRADRPTQTQVNSALNNGITPLVPDGETGRVAISRAITTHSLDAGSNPDYSVLDTSIVSTLDYETDAMQQAMAASMAGKKLGPDNADGSGPKVANMATPVQIRGDLYAQLKASEAATRLIKVDLHASLLIVQLDPVTDGRALATIPMTPTPGFHQFVAVVRQQS